MNDQQRGAYLDVIGIDRYVSKYQLPGAAASTPAPAVAPATPVPAPERVKPAGPDSRFPVDAPVGAVPEKSRVAAQPKQSRGGKLPAESPRPAIEGAPRFSIAAIVVGKWLWVEELAGIPLAREQVQLVQAMAAALERVTAGTSPVAPTSNPDVAQFDWPMHNNRQLDLGEDAATAALASFLARRLERGGLGLVLMGRAAAARVPLAELACPRLVLRHSSAEMLAKPALKKQAWADLVSSPGCA